MTKEISLSVEKVSLPDYLELSSLTFVDFERRKSGSSVIAHCGSRSFEFAFDEASLGIAQRLHFQFMLAIWENGAISKNA